LNEQAFKRSLCRLARACTAVKIGQELKGAGLLLEGNIKLYNKARRILRPFFWASSAAAGKTHGPVGFQPDFAREKIVYYS